MSAPTPGVSAVILAGGSSRRMGRPKPFLRVNGRVVLDRLLDEVASVASDLMVSVGDAAPFREALPEWGWTRTGPDREGRQTFRRSGVALRLVPDRRPGLGPLAGIEACAAEASFDRCLLVAVDLPFAGKPLFRSLLAELPGAPGPESGSPDGTRPRIVLPVVDGRRQPLSAAFERPAWREASACLDEGRRAVTAWVERLDVREVTGERRRLFDLDTPEDLRRARRWTRETETTMADPGGQDA